MVAHTSSGRHLPGLGVRSIVGGVAALTLVIGLLAATPASASAKPAPYPGKPLPGQSAAALIKASAPASASSLQVSERALPAPGDFRLKTPTSANGSHLTAKYGGTDIATVAGAWQQLGDSGIAVAPATDAAKPLKRQPNSTIHTPVTAVDASIVDGATVGKFGLKGLVIRLARTDSPTSGAHVAVRIPTATLAGLYGADFASRLRWVQVDGSRPPKTAGAAMRSAQSLPSVQDAASKSVVLAPMLASAPVMLAATASPVSATGTGSFTATSLKPSGSWDVSAQTGDFSWSYPMRVPPAAAGPAPHLAFSYDSQSVDGETGSTNNQPTAIGEGWSLAGSGFIERSYVPCATDNGSSGPVPTSGDLCWKTDNATISFAGHSGQLVKDTSTGVWKLHSDDGTRFEHLVGTSAGCAANGTYDTDCWRMTTTDGSQYFFGLNRLPGWATGKATTNSAWTVPVFGNDAGEPCHGASFAASSCAQAWRWNLDYVVDTHGNAESFYYNSQTNTYSAAGTSATSYVRGGELEHIDYGFTTGNAYAGNAASGKVVFGYDPYGRCSDAAHGNCTSQPASGNAAAPAHPTAYPDIPFDQNCVSGACTGSLSPTFWTTSMLATVTTKVLKSGAYANVDVWSLAHSFPDPGDSTSAALWLTQIGHTGYSGAASLSEPATTFTGATLQNRVWVIDGLAPLDKYRITSMKTAMGAVTSVNYSAQECTPANAAAIEAAPQSNTARCFPQWWTPTVTPPQPAQKDLFHKYVVTSVLGNPSTGGGNDATQETDYLYTGTPAWRYDTSPLVPDNKRTWSVFAGYSTVQIRVGDAQTPAAQQTTNYTFYQGMDGDRATTAGGTKTVSVTGSPGTADSLWFAGHTRQTTVLAGVGGAIISDTVTTPWAGAVTANDDTSTARMTGDADTLASEPISTGGTRTVHTTTSYDPTTGLPTQVSVVPSDAASSCTQTSYAATNAAKGIVGAVAEVKKVGVACASLGTASYPADAISDTRTSYDGGTLGAAPTLGDPTKTEIVAGYPGGAARWVTTSTTSYDTIGRPTQATDVLGHATTTAYTPAATAPAGSGATTAVTATNTAPFNWTTTTAFDPAWGAEVAATDQNGKVTTAAYDALGRRTGVWLPSHPQSTYASTPSTGYSYTLSQTGASSLQTVTQTANGGVPTFTLYDGLGRSVQTQTVAAGGGTVVADTAYDAAGRVAFTYNPYWTNSVNPSGTLFVPYNAQNIGSQTVTAYDGAGRTTTTTLRSYGVEKYHTSYAYPGADRVDTTPPAGGTPTSAYSNTAGQKTSLVQYLGATVNPAGPKQTTTYAYTKQGAMSGMTDPAGNAWAWGFDVLGHQITATDPDTGTTTSTVDDAGNVLTSTDGRGITLAYRYDNLNRKTGQYVGSITGAQLAGWTYDTVAKGQPATATSYVGSIPGTPGAAYTSAITGYDALYDPTGTTVTIPAGAPGFPGTTYTVASDYNEDGSVAVRTLPAVAGIPTERLRYSYDTAGRLQGLRGGQTYGTVFFTALGQVAQYARDGATSLYTQFGYDPATGAVTDIQDQTITGATATTVADRVYTRNDAGDVTALKTTGAGGVDTQCFGYDDLHDLTQAWTPAGTDCAAAPTAATIGGAAPYWTSYTTEAGTGNRTQVVHNPTTSTGTSLTDNYAYPAAGTAHPHAVNTLTHTGAGSPPADTYTYDAAGNTTGRPGQTLTYDAAGRLSTVTTGTTTQSNVYDAAGTLLLQTDPVDGTTLFLGDTELHVAAGSTTVSAVRTYTIGGIPLAERTTTPGVSGSVVTWLSGDASHTQDLEVIGATGALTRRFADPYGTPRGTGTTWTSSHGYLNAPTSTVTALTQLGARQYDPALGKFLTIDAILAPDNPGQNNGYTYAGNNPITNADPSGECYVGGTTDSLNHNTNCSAGGSNPTTHGNVAAPGPVAANATAWSHAPAAAGTSSGAGAHATALTPNKNGAIDVSRNFDFGTYTTRNPDWGGYNVDFAGAGAATLDGVTILCALATDGACGLFMVVGRTGVALVGAKDLAEAGVTANATASVTNRGIYVVQSETGTYVGQSGNILRRLGQHVANGKFTQAEVDAALRIAISGGKTSREMAEQLKIDQLGGLDGQLNKVNPIGPRRFDLMPDGYTR